MLARQPKAFLRSIGACSRTKSSRCRGVIVDRRWVSGDRTRFILPNRPSPNTNSTKKVSFHTTPSLFEPESQLLPQSSHDRTHITVYWSPSELNSPQSQYHHIWLRDHCRCPTCFHQVTKQRLLNTFTLPSDLVPVDVRSEPDGLRVSWPRMDGVGHAQHDSHTSVYPWDWLQRNSYDPVEPKHADDSGITLWSSSIASEPPTVMHDAVLRDEHNVHEWLQQLNRFGFCFVAGVPPTPEATESLARRIGFIRETQYGTFWDFTSDLSHGDTAYTSIALPAHTDTTYYTDPCALQLFHLLQPSSSGGHTLLVDGFHAANLLRLQYPRHFETLSTIKVPTHSAGDEDSFYSNGSGKPIISLDDDGRVQQIRWNNGDRSVMTDFRGTSVEQWYNAIRVWNQLLTDHNNEYWVPLKAGTALVIDNSRVLHGRSAFSGPRRMCGAYIGSDEYRSRRRVLTERFGSADASSYSGSIRDDRKAGKIRGVWQPGL